MSLEDKIDAMTAALDKNTALLEKIVSQAGAAPADKPKTTRTKKAAAGDDESGGDAEFDKEKLSDIRGKVGDWLGEFKADEKDPETAARKKLLNEALTKLGEGTAIKIGDITDDKMTDRVIAWFTKTESKGRLTGPLESEEGAGDDDI